MGMGTREMDGDLIYPGDLRGRVLPADRIDLAWDGNLICALVGPDLVVGVSGFGDSVHAALQDLADHLIAEAVWINVPSQISVVPPRCQSGPAGTIQADTIALRLMGPDRVCALI